MRIIKQCGTNEAKPRKRAKEIKNAAKGGAGSRQGMSNSKQKKIKGEKQNGPCWIGLQGLAGLGGNWVDPVGHGLV